MALVPAATELPDDTRRRLAEAIRRRWSRWVMAAILFLLVSGGYNFVVTLKLLPDQHKGLYHGLFGAKFLLALGIFFIASALAGRSEAFAKVRANPKSWLTINVALAVVLVCISGVLRAIPKNSLADHAAPASVPSEDSGDPSGEG
jgi:putative copper export protein